MRPARTAGRMAASSPATAEITTNTTRSSHGTATACTNDSGSASAVATPKTVPTATPSRPPNTATMRASQ